MLADFTPDEIVGQIDFTYIDDAITPAEAPALNALGYLHGGIGW